jgi:predicted double-glycine peptidase
MQPGFDTVGVLILVLLGISVGLSIWIVKRKLYLWLIILTIMVFAVSLSFGITHFSRSIWISRELKSLQTTFSKEGVCIQTTGFTCGAASAVTVLRQIGIEAQESELAILAKTTSTGTTNDKLIYAIRKLYGGKGIDCQYREFNSIAELKDICPMIAIIKLSPVVDHYTAVLEVTDDKVIIGDPLAGKKEWSYANFKNKWSAAGIVLKRR